MKKLSDLLQEFAVRLLEDGIYCDTHEHLNKIVRLTADGNYARPTELIMTTDDLDGLVAQFSEMTEDRQPCLTDLGGDPSLNNSRRFFSLIHQHQFVFLFFQECPPGVGTPPTLFIYADTSSVRSTVREKLNSMIIDWHTANQKND